MTNLTLIWAQGRDRAIGVGNTLPWRLPEDMAHFKAHTVGSPVIMGRKTFESFPGGPLPQRLNVVLTSKRGAWPESVVSVGSVKEALAVARQLSEHAYVIGGEQVYRLFMPLAQTLLVTRVAVGVPGADAFAPEISLAEWHCSSEGEVLTSKTGLQYQFLRYNRVAPAA